MNNITVNFEGRQNYKVFEKLKGKTIKEFEFDIPDFSDNRALSVKSIIFEDDTKVVLFGDYNHVFISKYIEGNYYENKALKK